MNSILVQLQDPIIAFIAIQSLLCLYLFFSSKRSSRELKKLERELFGLVKKLEGLTATKREQILKHYDQMLGQLETRIPTTVAAEASELIFDTESRILQQLAELEPTLKSSEDKKKKFNDLIVTMESLEDTIVSTTSDAVRKVIMENRETLLEIDSELIRQ